MNFNAGEDTFLKVKKSLNCRGRILDLSTPAIMAILNITPDSFYDGGNNYDEKTALAAVESFLKDGVDIIDIGGQSSRPGSKRITSTEEWNRIESPLKLVMKLFPQTIISVDTFYSEVAQKAIDEGAAIINDVSAGAIDPKLPNVAAENNTPYILMHMQGTPGTMQVNPTYNNVVTDVLSFFKLKVQQLKSMGIKDIIIDPGFGFGKTIEDNYALLKNLELFRIFECPVMAGFSRKSMITKLLNVKSKDALNGTTILNTIALLNGASILRVHDVKEAIQVRKIMKIVNS